MGKEIKDVFKNRITRSEMVEPSSLIKNPMNFKIHGDVQQRVMRDTLKEVGWVQSVVVNETTGRIIDGHMRVALAIDAGENLIPVSFVELDEDEERKALALFDPITMIGGIERGSYEALANSVVTDSMFVKDMLEQTAKNGVVDDDDGMRLASGGQKDSEKTFPEMELQPFEQYDYVMLLFKNSQDFYRAQELLGLSKVQVTYPGGLRKIGVTRVIDGAEALKKLTGE